MSTVAYREMESDLLQIEDTDRRDTLLALVHEQEEDDSRYAERHRTRNHW